MKNVCVAMFLLMVVSGSALAAGPVSRLNELLYQPGELKPIDSELKVKAGMMAPDFVLSSISGKKVQLSSFRGSSNVVLSFIPAAWTPVCSGQWPGYNIAEPQFRKFDAVLLGISVDNIPTLHAWTEEMGGLWFPVLSDFWPHGQVAEKYGVLRSDGTADRVLVFIDKLGKITAVHVNDINVRPPLEYVFSNLADFAVESTEEEGK